MRSSRPIEPLSCAVDFQAALRRRRIASSSHFDLFCSASARSAPRLGLIVGRKAAPSAAARNLVKRLARESARLAGALPPHDLVLRARAGLGNDWADAKRRKTSSPFKRALRAEIDGLLEQAFDKLSSR